MFARDIGTILRTAQNPPYFSHPEVNDVCRRTISATPRLGEADGVQVLPQSLSKGPYIEDCPHHTPDPKYAIA